MRYLILSDIHANLPAFKAVLNAAGKYDKILFLGDLANFGPHPIECVELMKSLDALCIIGNHDEFITSENPEHFWDAWARKQLSQEQLEWLSGFEKSCVIDGHILAIHGVYTEAYDILPNTPDSAIKKAFSSLLTPGIDEVWFGHYHYEIDRVVDGVTYRCIRPVGHHRDKDIRASYSIYEDGKIEHFRVSYDLESLVNDLKECDCFPDESLRNDFVYFVSNAYHEGFLKKDLMQMKLNEMSD